MSEEAAENLKRRFLVGDVTPDEREEIDRRFMEDPAFFEEVCALEDEILLSYERGELEEEYRRQLETRLAASPARMRRLEESRAFAGALSEPAGPRVPAGGRIRRSHSVLMYVAAAALITVSVGTWVLVRRHGTPDGGTTSAAPLKAELIERFFLRPDTTRTVSDTQVNVFRLRTAAQSVLLDLTVPEPVVNPRASLAPIGGPPVDGAFQISSTSRAGQIDVSIKVPARLLPPGDYIITLAAEEPGRGQEAIARRFFSVVP